MNPRKKFGDLLPPSRKQNPLATRKLKAKDEGLVDQDTTFSDFAAPPQQQPSREVSVGRMALISPVHHHQAHFLLVFTIHNGNRVLAPRLVHKHG